MKRNIIANYFGAGCVALAPVLALPWYLSSLGPEMFGLIGFVALVQALMGLIDAGMSQALVRAFSVQIDEGVDGLAGAADLLLGFERLYWSCALGAGALIFSFSHEIAAYWLVLEKVSVNQGQYALWGAAAIFMLQFPGSVYRSVLVGAQAQVQLNSVLAFAAVLRHLGGVVVVSIWPTLEAYLCWHALIAGLETLLRAWFAWHTLGSSRRKSRWDGVQMRHLWKTVARMSAATWLGALTVQMDKILVSKMVGIEQFGYYTIAATVATGVLQLVYPMMQAALPRAVQLRADELGLRRLSFRLSGMFALLVVGGGLGFAVLGKWVLALWLKDPAAVEFVYPILSLLLVGTALNALYNVGYMHWVVREKTQKIMQVNALALLLSLLLIPPLVTAYGPIGAAFGWLTINMIGFVLSLEWLKKSSNA
jgi:O-antigen/teichoic acid export membrane protein